MEQVRDDFTKADLSPRERRVADFVVKVTRAPNACSPADILALKEAGLRDKDILSLVQIAAYYNLSTRLFEPQKRAHFPLLAAGSARES